MGVGGMGVAVGLAVGAVVGAPRGRLPAVRRLGGRAGGLAVIPHTLHCGSCLYQVHYEARYVAEAKAMMDEHRAFHDRQQRNGESA